MSAAGRWNFAADHRGPDFHPMAEAFSISLENLLQGSSPGKRPEGAAAVPSSCREADLRVDSEETPAQWFVRLVDEPLQVNFQACALESDLAMFLPVG